MEDVILEEELILDIDLFDVKNLFVVVEYV